MSSPVDDPQYNARFKSLDSTRRQCVEAYGATEHLPPSTPLASILRGEKVAEYLAARGFHTIDDIMVASVQQLATLKMFHAASFRMILRATLAEPTKRQVA